MSRRGAWLGTAVLAVVLLVTAGVLAMTRHSSSPSASERRPAPALTPYERRVLAEVPGSYQVHGTVVLPATTHDWSGLHDLSARIVGTPVPMGFDGSVAPGSLPTTHPEAPYADRPPSGSQVVVDPGPLWIGCQAVPRRACAPVVLATADDGSRFVLRRLGDRAFLRRGEPMEAFVGEDFSGRSWHASIIGGVAGTSITRVVVAMADGATTDATVDTGRLSAGRTLFWARLPAVPRSVRAYDARGRLVVEHVLV